MFFAFAYEVLQWRHPINEVCHNYFLRGVSDPRCVYPPTHSCRALGLALTHTVCTLNAKTQSNSQLRANSMPAEYSASTPKVLVIKHLKHLAQSENFHFSEGIFCSRSQRRFSPSLHLKFFKAVSQCGISLGDSLSKRNPLNVTVMLVKGKYYSVSSFVRERGYLTEVSLSMHLAAGSFFSFQQRRNWQLDGF